MLKTYKYRLYPTKTQATKILFTLEHCRLLYNRLLDERKLAYRTEGKSLSCYDQQNTLKERKLHVPILKEVYGQVLQDVAKRLDKAYQNFFRRVKIGGNPGFPRFKAETQYNSFTYPQKGFSFKAGKLKLSKIGEVRIKLHRPLQGKLKTCTIITKNDKFYVCLACEVSEVPLPTSTKQVGVDLGLKHLAITSDGDFYSHPKFLKKSEQKLKKLQRALARKKKGSSRRAKAKKAVANLHEHIANQRKDYVHKVSRKLINQYGLIAFEDLQIQNMLQNHNLAKSISDAGWSKLVQYTTYKAESAGRHVVLVNPYNTTQLCSKCGKLVPKTLVDRVHICTHCGYTQDRDVNAAENILKLGLVI